MAGTRTVQCIEGGQIVEVIADNIHIHSISIYEVLQLWCCPVMARGHCSVAIASPCIDRIEGMEMPQLQRGLFCANKPWLKLG